MEAGYKKIERDDRREKICSVFETIVLFYIDSVLRDFKLFFKGIVVILPVKVIYCTNTTSLKK